QITKEYLGQDSHLAFLAPLWEEVLRADTYAHGPGSTVAKEIQGIAGVANVGSDRDWTGSDLNQANWYAFGRLAWDPTLSSASTARPPAATRCASTRFRCATGSQAATPCPTTCCCGSITWVGASACARAARCGRSCCGTTRPAWTPGARCSGAGTVWSDWWT